MRSLSRAAVLGTLAALIATPSAMAANTASAKVSPNKGGSLTLANPTKFTVKVATPDTPVDPSGNTQLQAIIADLPVDLLFNSIPFKPCNTNAFITTLSCPSSSKLGTATLTADGGPDVGVITAKTELFFGTGFAVLAHVTTDKPAVIDQAVIGSLRSSGQVPLGATSSAVSALYGLQLYIPVPKNLSEPVGGLFPTVKTTDASFAGPTKSTKVNGKKVKVPLVGLGPCKGKLAFRIGAQYGDATGAITKTDTAATTAKCKK